jgi:hypothetical protein
MTVSWSILVLYELIPFTCLMNSTAMLHSEAFSPRTSWGMQLDYHLIMSARKYSTLISNEGASIQFFSMALVTFPSLKVSILLPKEGSPTSCILLLLCGVCVCVCVRARVCVCACMRTESSVKMLHLCKNGITVTMSYYHRIAPNKMLHFSRSVGLCADWKAWGAQKISSHNAWASVLSVSQSKTKLTYAVLIFCQVK